MIATSADEAWTDRPASVGRLGGAACVLAIAVGATALPILAHLLGQVFGLAFCAVLAALVANYAVAAVPAALLCSFLFQNLMVALVSPALADAADFNAVRGYNFVFAAAVWLILALSYWTGPMEATRATRRLMAASTAVLGLVGVYFALGAISNPTNAAIYLRNFALPLMIFQACLVAAWRSPGPLAGTLKPLGYVILFYGYAELLARTSLYGLVGAENYLGHSMRQQIESGVWLRELYETGLVIRGLEDTLRVDLLNTPLFADLGIQLHRLLGPNFHSVSFAYALSFFSLLFLGAGQRLYALAALPLMVVIGSKGALVSLLLSAGALFAFRMSRSRAVLWLLIGVLGIYTAAAITLGLLYGDYHVMGLIGGINGFLRNPFGHGLGAGGNLSIDMTKIDWSRSQALGQTDLAVESAVGVLLFQMGFAGLLVCAVPIAVALTCWRHALLNGRPHFAAVAFGLLTVTVNGLLQEEALFAPLALGSLMLLAGVALGEAAARDPEPSRAEPRGGPLATLSPPAVASLRLPAQP